MNTRKVAAHWAAVVPHSSQLVGLQATGGGSSLASGRVCTWLAGCVVVVLATPCDDLRSRVEKSVKSTQNFLGI